MVQTKKASWPYIAAVALAALALIVAGAFILRSKKPSSENTQPGPSPTSPSVATTLTSTPAPANPQPSPNGRIIPAGPGKEFVIGKKPASLESVPLRPQDFPKVDLEEILSRKSLKDDFKKQTVLDVENTYRRLNSSDSPGFENGLLAVKLFAISTMAGDQSESFSQTAAFYAQLAAQQGNTDLLVKSIAASFLLSIHDPTSQAEIDGYLADVLNVQTSEYSAAIKLSASLGALTFLGSLDSNQADRGMLPIDPRHDIMRLLDSGVINLETMARQKAPAAYLFFFSNQLLQQTTINGRRPSSQIAVISSENDTGARREDYEARVAQSLQFHPDSEFITSLLKAKYLIDLARDVAFRMSASDMENQVRQLRGYINQAETLLLTQFEKHPESYAIPTMMLEMSFGRNWSKEEIEKWYQKAIANNPGQTPAVFAKFFALSRNRETTSKEIFDFILDCNKSPQWEANRPKIVTYGLTILTRRDPSNYDNDSAFELISRTYRDHLQRLPKEIETRTDYLLLAYQNKDWPTVKEQLAALGNYWAIKTISRSQYAKIVSAASRE